MVLKLKGPLVFLSFWFCDYIILHHHVCHHCLIPLFFSTLLFILNDFAVCTWSIHEALFYQTPCHKQLSFKKAWVSISKLKKGSLVFTCHFFWSSDQLFQLEKGKRLYACSDLMSFGIWSGNDTSLHCIISTCFGV